MPYMWSAAEHDEVWVDEHEGTDVICAECGEMEWYEDVHWDDDTPFCDACFVEIFGEDSAWRTTAR